jgi:nicotinic acid mononucleotide adenylyltransferase
VALARAALEQLPIEKLVVLVAERPGHREVVADADARLRMARAAFEELEPVEVVLDPHPHTVDAVRGGRFGDAIFILGADQAGAFGNWKDPDEVLRWVELAAGTRAGHPHPKLERFGERVRFFTLDSPLVSSTDVRERVAAGEPIGDLVPAPVAQVIEKENLYG